jgi:hypothetical protein
VKRFRANNYTGLPVVVVRRHPVRGLANALAAAVRAVAADTSAQKQMLADVRAEPAGRDDT